MSVLVEKQKQIQTIVSNDWYRDSHDEREVVVCVDEDQNELILTNRGLVETSRISLPSLQLINVDENLLEKLNMDAHDRLLSLSASSNRLKTFDCQLFVNLSHLTLDSNALISLNVQHLYNLKYLSVERNHLVKIQGLQSCSKLTRLRLGHNQISALSDLVGIAALLKLRELQVHSNLLSLSHLIASLSSLESLRVDVKQMPLALRQKLIAIQAMKEEDDCELQLSKTATTEVKTFFQKLFAASLSNVADGDNNASSSSNAPASHVRQAAGSEWVSPYFYPHATVHMAELFLEGMPARTAMVVPSMSAVHLTLLFVGISGEIVHSFIRKLPDGRLQVAGADQPCDTFEHCLQHLRPLPPSPEQIEAVNAQRAARGLPPLQLDAVTSSSDNSTLSVPQRPPLSSNGSSFSIVSDASSTSSEHWLWMRCQPWFYGVLSRQNAEEILRNQPPGAFLIRIGSHANAGNGDWLTQSIVNEPSRIIHVRIQISGEDGSVTVLDHNSRFQSFSHYAESYNFFPCAASFEHIQNVNSFRREAGLSELSLPAVSSSVASSSSSSSRDRHIGRIPTAVEAAAATSSSAVQQRESLIDECKRSAWYFPNVNREAAELMLQTQPAGTFLVRPSSTPGQVVLSTSEEFGAVSHVALRLRADGRGIDCGSGEAIATSTDVIYRITYGAPYKGSEKHMAAVRERQKAYARKHDRQRAEQSHATQDDKASNVDASREGDNCCAVCLDAARDVVLLPCAHVCVCSFCASQLNKCPICNSAIAQIVKLFFS